MQLALQSALYNSGIFSLQSTMAFNGIIGNMLGKSKNAGNAWLVPSDTRHVFSTPVGRPAIRVTMSDSYS
jgi:hypothetical protein